MSERLVVDKVTVKIKSWVVFRQYTPKKLKTFQHQNLVA